MSLSHQAKQARRNRLSHTVSRVTGSVILIAFVIASLTLLAGTAAAVPTMAPESSSGGVQSIDVGGLVADPAERAGDPVVSSTGTTPSLAETDDRPTSRALTTSDSRSMVSDRAGLVAAAPADGHGPTLTALTSRPTALDVEEASSETTYGPTGVDGIVTRADSIEPRVPVAGEVRALDLDVLMGDMAIPLQPEKVVWPWGLTPDIPISPATAGGIAFGFFLGAGAYAIARPNRLSDSSVEAPTPNEPLAARDRDERNLDDDDLLPDEAVVEGLLLRQDGRMRQSAIVDMTDWSKAKVSRLLSAMTEEGRIVKVRMGRENLICLDGWEPDAAKTPFGA